MQDPSERAPPPRVGPHPPSLRRCAGFGCSTGSAAVLGGGGGGRAAAELYALDSARAAKPGALFCSPPPPEPPPSQTRDISAGPAPGMGWQERGWRGRKAGYEVL